MFRDWNETRNAEQAIEVIEKACAIAERYIEPLAQTRLNWTIEELAYIKQNAIGCILKAVNNQELAQCSDDAGNCFQSAFGPMVNLALSPFLWDMAP